GPTLWSSDLDVFAQPSGGNGSHLDMLHESPYSQGIAAETDNVFWVFDGYNHDLVRYDFAEDHNPGNSWHGDAIIHRFSDDVLNRDPSGVVPSHLVLDQNKQWLYAVDNGNNRVIRIDINTGVPSAESPSYGPHEDVAEYLTYTGYTSEVVVSGGMQKPAGIALISNKLLVSDYATGKIHVFDISALPAQELFQIQTPAEGIMGIVIDPEGRIVYADHDNSEIVMVSPGALSLNNVSDNLLVYPNPAHNYVKLTGNISSSDQVTLLDISGRVISQFSLSAEGLIVVSSLSPGMYFFRVSSDSSGLNQVIPWVKN
ncbi:MAG: T9SS type A sorting domain-containing protein, partial [Bacteroidetes bacterium]|nr:T9SS type A sorting domain-containing protein [Bacteroidota bacterium]